MIEEGIFKETPKSIQTELAYVMTYSISLFPKRLEARRALHPALTSPRKECRDLKELGLVSPCTTIYDDSLIIRSQT